jgi:hypothetical protein
LNIQTLSIELTNLLWILVNSISEVSCPRIRDLDSNFAYTKNQLVSWPDDKRNYHGTDAISSNPIISIYIIQIKIKLTNLLVIFLTYNHILLFKLFIKVKY